MSRSMAKSGVMANVASRDRDAARIASKDGGESHTGPVRDKWGAYEARHDVARMAMMGFVRPDEGTMTDAQFDSTYASTEDGDDAIMNAGREDGTDTGLDETVRNLDDNVPDEREQLTLNEGGEYLDITGAALKRLIMRLDVAPDGVRIGHYGNRVSLYSIGTLERIAKTDAYAKEVERHLSSLRRREMRTLKTDERMADERDRVTMNVIVNVRQRTSVPRLAEVFVGPTNSGKSHNAIERLVSDYEHDPDGTYVYAGPLRMLAYEVYEKLRNRPGIVPGDVGFITGEEQINPDARIVCCTVEMAPMSGASIVLDEAHWMVDADRGQHWTNLLIGGEYEKFYVITAGEAEDTVERLLSDAETMDIHHYDRLTPISYGGTIDIGEIRPRTAVIAFSRRSVYELARKIHRKTGLRCGVLYGALPLDVRREQIGRYASGRYDVMVTTDVIGHGINLPIDNVVFSQTDKFDGTRRRQLYLWEAAQIAGRAGRYGLGDGGCVYALDDDYGRRGPCDTSLVANAVMAARGDMQTDLNVSRALVTPRFEDLGITDPSDLMLSMDAWSQLADSRLSDAGIAPAPMAERRRLISAIAGFSGSPLYPWSVSSGDWVMTPRLVWELSGAPLDPDGDALYYIVCWACDENPDESAWLVDYYESLRTRVEVATDDIDCETASYELEQVYAGLEQLRTIHAEYGTLGTLAFDNVEELSRTVTERIARLVSNIGTSDANRKAQRIGTHGRRRTKRRKAA